MNFPSNHAEAVAARVLVLAPSANDSRLTVEFLRKSGLRPFACETIRELRDWADEKCGAIILAEEALAGEATKILLETLEGQPSWSDIPIVLITSGGEISRDRIQCFALLGPGGNVGVLERPFRPDTLISSVVVALKTRARQFQVRDLLEALKKARDEAEQASRAKDEFLAALSHELRTPLNPVLLIAGAGAVDPVLPARVREDYAVIRKNINLEAKLIDDLLDLTSISRGKLLLDLRTCDVHEILTDVLFNMQAEIRSKGIRLMKNFGAVHSLVKGDSVRLQQVFWNLLRNAIKFVPEGGFISLATENQIDNLMVVRVQDSGVGISEEDLNKVFDPFTQGSHAPTIKSAFNGLGMGLYISRKLVELHEGTIHAESQGRDKGATFVVQLPISMAPIHAFATTPLHKHLVPKACPENRIKILLVDDHQDTLLSLALLLRSHFDVITASSGAEARAHLLENLPDLVVSDIGLPDEKGYDLMKHFHATYGLQGIALTGYGMEEDIAKNRASGFVTHLTKPVEFHALIHAIHEITQCKPQRPHIPAAGSRDDSN